MRVVLLFVLVLLPGCVADEAAKRQQEQEREKLYASMSCPVGCLKRLEHCVEDARTERDRNEGWALMQRGSRKVGAAMGGIESDNGPYDHQMAAAAREESEDLYLCEVKSNGCMMQCEIEAQRPSTRPVHSETPESNEEQDSQAQPAYVKRKPLMPR